ncbi:flavodoxin domain-containing protein [Egicoccus sp. AB-alg6-2]|uniref:flavodoxin domain-containing protein n=1 Tax=Egicoccus sp. AB-alg6-2 TaxID=3242692 RepID=UPI00359D3393
MESVQNGRREEVSTMRALVVYESMFGNTAKIATAIVAGLRDTLEVVLSEAHEAPTQLAAGWDLVVVGGPTHAFGMSRASTRTSAVEHGAPAGMRDRQGIREWLADVSIQAPLPLAAAFDTKVARPDLPGSAAHKAARRLRSLGLRLQLPPETFLVEDLSGPLLAGEVDRASAWGRELAAKVTGRHTTPAARSRPSSRARVGSSARTGPS